MHHIQVPQTCSHTNLDTRLRPQEEVPRAAALKESAVTRLSFRLSAVAAALLLFCHLSAPAIQADDEPASKPRLKVVLAGADRVLADLSWVIADLAQEKNQWETNIKEMIETFLFGVDRELPIRFDVLLGGGQQVGDTPSAYRLQPSIPVERDGKDVRTFIKQNLEPIGINARQKSRGGYYELQQVYEGWMRMVEEYACIGTFESDVPKGMPHPKESHEKLIEAGFDVALEFDNKAEQTEERMEAFDGFASNLIDATKQKEDESDAAFALRKEGFTQQLALLERVFVDASRVTIGLTIDVDKEQGRADLYGEGFPETELAAYIEAISVEPSAFTALPMPEDPAASLRINLPFSDLQKQQLAKTYELSKPVTHEKIDGEETITSEEKGPAKQISDLVFDMLTEGIDVGRLDLFFDMTVAETGEEDDPDTHVILIGVRAADGKKADEIVKLIPQAHTKWSVEMDVKSVGETTIHKVDISEDLPQSIRDTFGDSGAVYVGTSTEIVWICGGPGSLELLTEAITQVDDSEAPGEVSPVFGEFKAHSHKLISLYHNLSVEMGWELFGGPVEVKPRNENSPVGGGGLQPIDPIEIREIAVKSTADIDDRISGEARRVDHHAEGEILIAPGLMRAVGDIVAKIVDDNL